MTIGLVSTVEQDFVERGVEAGMRVDGRARDDYRPPQMEVNLVAQSDGSARCQLGGGSTDVLVSVRCELGQPLPPAGDRGHIAVSVECSPSATQRIEGRTADDVNVELSEALARAMGGPRSGLRLEQLCIIRDLHCWVLNIDAIVLEYGGNVLDALLYATRAALSETRVPHTEVQSMALDDADEGDGAAAEMDFEVNNDVGLAKPLDGVDQLPLCVTANKIGAGYVLDATFTEELCASARLHVAVNAQGEICASQKSGDGAIEPSLLMAMLQAAQEQAKYLLQRQNDQLRRYAQEVAEKQQRGEPIKRPSVFV